MKTLIIYHTGVGNTKTIASMLYKSLINKFDITLMSIERYIYWFFTYHSAPSTSILKYLDRIKSLSHNKLAYIFTT